MEEDVIVGIQTEGAKQIEGGEEDEKCICVGWENDELITEVCTEEGNV